MRINLKQFRLPLNMSQSELAARVGVSRIHINKIERNNTFPSGAILKRISRVLNVCPYRLIDFCTSCLLENCQEAKFFLPIK